MAKFWSMRGASHQPALLLATWQLARGVCPIDLVDELVLVFYALLWLGSNGGSVDVFGRW